MFYLQEKQRVNQMPLGQNWELGMNHTKELTLNQGITIICLTGFQQCWGPETPHAYQPHTLPPLEQEHFVPQVWPNTAYWWWQRAGSRYLFSSIGWEEFVLETQEKITFEKLSCIWSQSGWDPYAAMGWDFGGLWSAVAASLQWPPPTLSRVGSVTNGMRHERWCVTSKIRSQKTVLSLGCPLSCYSPDQQLYWDYERPQASITHMSWS